MFIICIILHLYLLGSSGVKERKAIKLKRFLLTWLTLSILLLTLTLVNTIACNQTFLRGMKNRHFLLSCLNLHGVALILLRLHQL